MEFKEFNKISRLSREVVITEKIDGTNASIYIGENGEFLTGSRTRWITPEDDNYGFSKWAHEHKEELLTLGHGHHFGEWWGRGIQRKYNLTQKRFSLFNVSRFCLHNEEPKLFSQENPTILKSQQKLPECCSLVPVLYTGVFDTNEINRIIELLKQEGSRASPGFMKPEGIVIYHTHARILFKKTIDKDDASKFTYKNKAAL